MIGLCTTVNTIYNIKQTSSENKDYDFEQWLSGFIDAEGNFQVAVERDKYVRLMFRINLHIDDVGVLKEIQNYLKVGYVETHKHSCTFVIRKTKDIITVLLPILENNTLRTTKYFDYVDFRRVAYMIEKKSRSEHLDISLVTKISRAINSKRDSVDISQIPATVINISWLIGFIEGEGTFGFKSLTPYFQIGQHVRNKHVLVDTSVFLESLDSLFTYSTNRPSIKISHTVNRLTNVLVISNSNVDWLFDVLAHHFLNCTFRTRKGTDFYYWCIALYMQKYGYCYSTVGRNLAVSIANYINKSRYSTATNKVTVPVIDIAFLTSILPVKLTPTISHLELSKEFAKIQKGRVIWVYDNQVIVKGSPFTTIAAASESIGLSRTSITVRRYLDTGKLYINRYIFRTTASSFLF